MPDGSQKWKKTLADALTAFARALHIVEISEEAPEKTPGKEETPTPRPSQRLEEFIGDEKDRSSLKYLIAKAREHHEALGHVLLIGPPGFVCSTVAQIVARDLGVNCRETSGLLIAKAGDIANFLTNLEPRDVLFIDEIHRLNPAVENILYQAMKDFQLDLIIGEGPAARPVKIDLSPFTLIGASAFEDQISAKLPEQFALRVHMGI